MKFSDIENDTWEQLQPYLDTVLLPLSGLTGKEAPFEATAALERLRDALEPLETTFRGRVVTYPALHYSEDAQSLARLADKLCARLREEASFRYCIVVAGSAELLNLTIPNASAIIGPQPPSPDVPTELYRSRATRLVEALWRETAP